MIKVALLCSALLAASAHAGEPVSALKEEVARTGTHIKRDVAWSKAIPVNLRYHELDAGARAVLADQYESLGEGDEPPFPQDGLQGILKPLSKGQQKLLVRGTMKLFVDVGADGKAKAVSLAEPFQDETMVNFVASVLMLTPYKPGMCKGVPCAMQYPFSIDFAVNR
jgi:hypothetical protein